MSIGSGDLLLLDTNVLIHWVRQDRTGVHLKERYALDRRAERPLFSTITEGEILSLATYWNWGTGKRKLLSELLAELVRLEAGLPEVVAAYAELFVASQRQGKNSGQNDLWIAACAQAAGAVLLTCDLDFVWLSPAYVRVEHVPEIQ